MVARGRGKKAAVASEAAVALANGDGETQGNEEVASTNAVAPVAGKKGRARGIKKEVKEEPEESPPVEVAEKPTKAGKPTKGAKKVPKGKAALAPEAEEAPPVDPVKDVLENNEAVEENIKTAEKKTQQRKRKADNVDKVEEPAAAVKKASKTKTKAAKKETVDSAGVPENPAAKLTSVLPEEQTNGNKKSSSNRKRAAPKVEEASPSADEGEPAEEEVAANPPAAKKASRGRAPKKDAKKPAAKATKGSKKVAKAPEDEAPEDDVLPEDEFNPEEDKEEESSIPEPEPEPEVKAKKPVKSKGSRKQLKDDIPPVEEEVAELKDEIPEVPDSEEEVKKPKGRKPAAKKASAAAAAKSTSKKTTKAKKNAKAESAEDSANDDQDAADVDLPEKKANGTVKLKVAPAEKKKGRGTKRSASTPSEIDEADGAKSAKPDGFTNATETDFKTEDFTLDKEFKLKISSWNIAGLRSWLKKDKLAYLQHEQPDVLCLQETKCTTDQLPEEARIPGYHPYWLCMPGGHAGVAVYSKIMPINVEYGIGSAEHDDDGRMITAEYEKFYLICVYVPNSGRKLVNLEKRLRWEQLFREYVQRLDKIKPVIIAGDMNVSHKEIDLANPKTNTKNAGFTPEERDAMTKLLELGYVDTFRHLYPDKKGAYTFWSYLGKARSKNVGWRLDYFIVSERITSKVVENTIRAQVLGSDHCPITLFLNI